MDGEKNLNVLRFRRYDVHTDVVTNIIYLGFAYSIKALWHH